MYGAVWYVVRMTFGDRIRMWGNEFFCKAQALQMKIRLRAGLENITRLCVRPEAALMRGVQDGERNVAP